MNNSSFIHFSPNPDIQRDRETLNTILESFTFWIANNTGALREKELDATVEAEFGDEVVEGRCATLAHHGPRSENECPCVAEVDALPIGAYVGISHVDADTIGGILRLAGYKPQVGSAEDLFWQLVAKVDVQGPHKLRSIMDEMYDGIDGPSRKDLGEVMRPYYALYAWLAAHRYPPVRHADAVDCTGFVRSACCAVMDILGGDPELLKAGDDFLLEQEKLDRESFWGHIEMESFSVLLRISPSFVNHLYNTFLYDPADLVFAHNAKTGAITLSKANEFFPLNCAGIMKQLFGAGAGGRSGIAGSPRGVRYSEIDYKEYAHKLILMLDELGKFWDKKE